MLGYRRVVGLQKSTFVMYIVFHHTTYIFKSPIKMHACQVKNFTVILWYFPKWSGRRSVNQQENGNTQVKHRCLRSTVFVGGIPSLSLLHLLLSEWALNSDIHCDGDRMQVVPSYQQTSSMINGGSSCVRVSFLHRCSLPPVKSMLFTVNTPRRKPSLWSYVLGERRGCCSGFSLLRLEDSPPHQLSPGCREVIFPPWLCVCDQMFMRFFRAAAHDYFLFSTKQVILSIQHLIVIV